MLKIGVCSILRNVAFIVGLCVIGYFLHPLIEERNEKIALLHKAEDAKLASLEKLEKDEVKK